MTGHGPRPVGPTIESAPASWAATQTPLKESTMTSNCRASCACGQKFTGTYPDLRAWHTDHGCTLPPKNPEPPYTAADLVNLDDDAPYFDVERDALLDAYDGGPS